MTSPVLSNEPCKKRVFPKIKIEPIHQHLSLTGRDFSRGLMVNGFDLMSGLKYGRRRDMFSPTRVSPGFLKMKFLKSKPGGKRSGVRSFNRCGNLQGIRSLERSSGGAAVSMRKPHEANPSLSLCRKGQISAIHFK
jgi:hypothetical protein